MNSNKKKVFLVWTTDGCDDGDDGYWNQYSTLEDAVSTEGDGCEVYLAEPKYIGKFKRKVEMVKIKARKRHK